MVQTSILPRFIRAKDAPAYLGMNRNDFNQLVKPHLTAIPRGKQGRAYDRLDLDAWADEDKRRNGRPPKKTEGTTRWEEKERQVSLSVVNSGTLIRKSKGMDDFVRALDSAMSNKRTSTSRTVSPPSR